MNKKSIVSDAILIAPKINHFSQINMVIALMISVISYLSVRFVHPFHMEIWDTFLLVIYLHIALFYAKCFYPITKSQYKRFAFLLICCIPNAIFDNYMLKFFNLLFILFTLGYLLLSISSKQLNKQGKYLFVDLMHAIIYIPSKGLKNIMVVLKDTISKSFHLQHLREILIGCLISIPLLSIVMNLLTSADNTFHYFISNIFFHINIDILLTEIFYLLLTIPVFAYLYAFIYAQMNYEWDEVVLIKEEQIEKGLKKIAIVPISIPLTIELLFIIVYATFLCISTMDILSNMHRSLDSFSFSQFARQGFFQLCIIACINLVVLLSIEFLKQPNTSLLYPWIKKLLCIETLLLICTAMLKMILYIHAYGLTPLRVYASWFMLVLFGVFALVILHDKYQTEKWMRNTAIYFSICFLMLNMCNMNTLIKQYNTSIPTINQEEPYYDMYP